MLWLIMCKHGIFRNVKLNIGKGVVLEIELAHSLTKRQVSFSLWINSYSDTNAMPSQE